eukprot:965408-Rhodomonas_salina.1
MAMVLKQYDRMVQYKTENLISETPTGSLSVSLALPLFLPPFLLLHSYIRGVRPVLISVSFSASSACSFPCISSSAAAPGLEKLLIQAVCSVFSAGKALVSASACFAMCSADTTDGYTRSSATNRRQHGVSRGL